MLRERSADVEADGRLELGAQRRDVDVARDHQPERDVSDLDGSAYLLQKRDELEVFEHERRFPLEGSLSFEEIDQARAL